ncbi:hypothetical protein CR51_11855 [Caballeronia megalochromosomata]|nr:hypothetical protein CR51_11855 [Caballeronia megalochromosomata]
MRKDMAAEHARDWDLEYVESREPLETKARAWVNDEQNQESLLNGFFDVLRPHESLVFFYAKKTPLTDEFAAVLIGVARIASIPEGKDWDGSENGKRQVFWDRVIPHTLRADFVDGFLMPYADILAACRSKDIDPSAYTAFVPDATGTDFKYRAGLVSPDSALAALRSLHLALTGAMTDLQLSGTWHQAQRWLSARISECWADRGPCPGLRAALSAAGVTAASRVALILHELAQGGDPWPIFEGSLDGTSAHPDLQRRVRGLFVQRIREVRDKKPEQWQVIKLLSRFNLTKNQAIAWFKRADAQCAIEDPYQLYLRTRRDEEPIPFHAIDRTLYGEKPRTGYEVGLSADWHNAPIDEPRRIAAIAVACLERGAVDGHTWLPEKAIVQMVPMVVEDQVPPVLEGDMSILASLLAGEVHEVAPDGWQLHRLHAAESLIREEITSRLARSLEVATFDARALVDETIGKPVDSERDDLARGEKAVAIDIIAKAAISTLDGPAGTGKTTAIKALFDVPTIGSVLCLAPTGKARVQIERAFKSAQARPEIKTVHSFLLSLQRWNNKTRHFDVSRDGSTSGQRYQTVIIDEASMFDVEMLAAVLAACSDSARIVLVGDPRQLPPIGAGRPFVDIVTFLRAEEGPACHLESIMRAQPGEEAAFEFARLFDLSRNGKDDEPWSWPGQPSVGNIHFRYWRDEEELRGLLTHWVNADLLSGVEPPAQAFDAALGANRWKEKDFYFGLACGPRADAWQILSPRRSGAAGSDELNLHVKDVFRRQWTTLATDGVENKAKTATFPVIPKPMGNLQVTYGDKVICNNNQTIQDYYSPSGKPLEYVANGEVGIAIGPRRTSKHPKIDLSRLGVEFSSQPGTEYRFEIDEEDALELAYALTVHRTQGSQFGQTVIVVPDTHFVGPEMLYTALTRSEGKVTLLVQSTSSTLLAATLPRRSAVARRLTNVFAPSEWGCDGNLWFDRGRIHLATDGTWVRSKSELVICNLLHGRRVEYGYEIALARGDQVRRPDFTIKTSGRIYYWEHLGMLTDSGYARDWARKKAWYESNGITTHSERERLIVTEDEADGSLDSKKIERIIDELD